MEILPQQNLENPISEKTDEQLVVLALEKPDNFLYLIQRYKGKLIAYIRRITNINSDDAEDILQEVFIKVYQNLNDFDTDLKFSSWIYRITHNQVISHYRKNNARPEGHALDIEDKELQSIADELHIPSEIDKGLLRQNIYKVLDGLDEKYREVLILKFLEEKSYTEISDIIKKPMGTVASMINKAKSDFRKELDRLNIKL